MPTQTSSSGADDFDFLMGRWRVAHRRLKKWLSGSSDWTEFEGTNEAWKVLGGLGNVDDNWMDLPGGAYRAVTLRSFDPQTQQWTIWWLDGRRRPARLADGRPLRERRRDLPRG